MIGPVELTPPGQLSQPLNVNAEQQVDELEPFMDGNDDKTLFILFIIIVVIILIYCFYHRKNIKHMGEYIDL